MYPDDNFNEYSLDVSERKKKYYQKNCKGGVFGDNSRFSIKVMVGLEVNGPAILLRFCLC